MRPVPQGEELPVPKPQENLIFNDDISDSDWDHEQQEGDNVDCNLTFEASCSSSEPYLLTQWDLNDLVCDLNYLKTSWTLRFQTKKVKSSPPNIVKYVSFAIAKMN
jgi:hypothetical protein